MSSVNKARAVAAKTEVTHGGTSVRPYTNEQQLTRAVLSCMLWEKQFYEEGVDIATRIASLVPLCQPHFVAQLAIEARKKWGIRHAPLLLITEMLKHPLHKAYVSTCLEAGVIHRADDMSELLALYWASGKKPLAKQLKKGLANAFVKFNAYALAKYKGFDKVVSLRDVLFMVHPKPKDKEQALAFKGLADKTIASPDTWEVALSSGADKKETFTRLIRENKLGGLALLRNLRNMASAGVDNAIITLALDNMSCTLIEPFRFIAANKYAVPALEPAIERAFLRAGQSYKDSVKRAGLDGKSVAVLVDHSGSMIGVNVSAKSELDRLDAASALAAVIREAFDNTRVFSFENKVTEVRPRRGFALIEEIKRCPSGGTNLYDALHFVKDTVNPDITIVITDEQDTGGTHRWMPTLSKDQRGFVLNVGSYKNGVSHGQWTNISGFSDAVVKYLISDLTGGIFGNQTNEKEE